MVGSCAMLKLEVVMAGNEAKKESALIRSALAVLLERGGGSMTYTQTEYSAVAAKLGHYSIVGEVDRSLPGEPRIVVKLVQTPGKATGPVS
jgi:hypothetical protein